MNETFLDSLHTPTLNIGEKKAIHFIQYQSMIIGILIISQKNKNEGQGNICFKHDLEYLETYGIPTQLQFQYSYKHHTIGIEYYTPEGDLIRKEFLQFLLDFESILQVSQKISIDELNSIYFEKHYKTKHQNIKTPLTAVNKINETQTNQLYQMIEFLSRNIAPNKGQKFNQDLFAKKPVGTKTKSTFYIPANFHAHEFIFEIKEEVIDSKLERCIQIVANDNESRILKQNMDSSDIYLDNNGVFVYIFQFYPNLSLLLCMSNVSVENDPFKTFKDVYETEYGREYNQQCFRNISTQLKTEKHYDFHQKLFQSFIKNTKNERLLIQQVYNILSGERR